MKKLESYLLDNMDVTGYMVREINAWGGYLEHLEYFDMEELLIGKDYWNFVCDDSKGFDVVFEQYQKSSKYIKDLYEENYKTLLKIIKVQR